MTKQKITTTYRREFSPERSAKRPSVVQNIDANTNYREHRRQLEHGHHKSPFVWDDWEYELESAGQAPVAESVRNRASEVEVPSSSHSESSVSLKPELQDQQVQTTLRTDRHPPKSTASRSSSVSSMESECNCGASRENRTNNQCKKIAPRSHSDTLSKKLKNVSKKKQKKTKQVSCPRSVSPFAQYGTGDEEVETGNKRTYNVLSSQGVYSSAAKAHRRFQSAKELQNQRNLNQPRPHKTTMFDPQFDQRMNKQTSRWISEYQKNYQQHPADDYLGHIQHRPPY